MTSERDEAVITAYPDGPLIVRGSVTFRNEAGETIVQPRRTAALCRCGVSSIKPWCDGTHKTVGFRTAPPDPAGDADKPHPA